MQNRKVLVVGASGVLGSHLANQIIALGNSVIGTASSVASVSALPAKLTQSYFLDLGDEDSIDRFAESLSAEHPVLDGVILASGLVAFGNLESTPPEVANRLMQVNYIGQQRLLQRTLGQLVAAKADGRDPFIVTISGVISETPMAGLSAYAASKSALHALSVAAGRELRRSGINWIDARPGHTETGLATRAIFGTAPQFTNGLNAEFVASRIISAIESGERDLPSSAFA